MELGGLEPRDLLIANQALSQLSYSPSGGECSAPSGDACWPMPAERPI